MTALPRHSPPSFVGRDRELATLRAQLAAVLAGQGRLVLIGGEAGIGKTALAAALCDEARTQGVLVLVGRCYDLSETPPYGPWTEARSQFSSSSALISLSDASSTPARNSQEFFASVRAFFTNVAMRQPLLVLLDDMQWADPASLDLLRFLARSLASLPVMLIVTYRPDDLDHHHPFSQIIPLLVRESGAERLDLTPLSAMALRRLVSERYCLGTTDETRLVAYLVQRTDGNALFVTEMLRALEERGIVTAETDALGNLEEVAVPPLLRQIVVGRVARLGAKAERLLGVAAVIGQEVPLDTWARVSEADDATVEAVAEQGLGVRLLVETREGVAFSHALIREALYEAMPILRRRRLHRAVGEALAADTDAAPDTVACHFAQAGDSRAGGWLTKAAWQAYRASAYETARTYFAQALPTIAATERARALLALASLDRYRERGTGYATEAIAAAHAAGDAVFAACAQFQLGAFLCFHGRIGEALRALEGASEILDAQPDETLPDLYGLSGLRFSRYARKTYHTFVLASGGRWREALALLGATPETLIDHIGDAQANRGPTIYQLCVLLGRIADARQLITVLLALYEAREDDLALLATHVSYGAKVLLPFLLDDREARQQYDADILAATRRVEQALGAAPPYLNCCPLLIVEGRWTEARALWAQRHGTALTTDLATNLPHIGAMARAQGKREEAWALVREGVPDGPRSAPGTTNYIAVDLLALAARLALDDGQQEQARAWLGTHDRWFAWAGPEARWGRANGHLAWAEYYRTVGEPAPALRHVELALAEASAPRQPLMLLAAHRLLGELATDAGTFAAAANALQAALALAEACAAPYERALTLLALAELAVATGDGAAASRLLAEARARCTPLGARQALDRAERLASRLAPHTQTPAPHPHDLSPRETAVLRLIAAGHTNPQIAAALSLSVRTIERHVENLYRKLDVHGRAEAIAYALRQDVV